MERSAKPKHPHSAQPAIEIESLSKRYRSAGGFRSVRALDGVSFNVGRGEIFGFLGPNGAGKTSLIKILVGLAERDGGSCRILGVESWRREARRRLGYLPERPYYHDFLSAEEFLRFHGRLLGMDGHLIDKRIPALLEKVGLGKSRRQRLRDFSKGMLQRIGFAQALLHDPEVLILDEPMSGLDPVGRREVRDIITGAAAEGKTILFSTHIIHDVEVICTTVGFIAGGRLRGAGNIDSLLGKTVRSVEIRFSLPHGHGAHKHARLKAARKTMDGWVLDVEADAERLESEVDAVLSVILSEKGSVRAVAPRKSTLEDLFFEGKKP